MDDDVLPGWKSDPVSGVERFVAPEPTRPGPFASAGEVAQRQTARALEAMRARGASDDEIRDARCRLAVG